MADNILCDIMAAGLKAIMDTAIAAADPQPSPLPTAVEGKNSGDKGLPTYVCEGASDGEEDMPKNSGNFWIAGAVTLKHTAVDDAGDEVGAAKANDQLCVGLMNNAIITDTIEADLQAAARGLGYAFTIFPQSISFEAPRRDQNEAGVWEDTIQFKALCCASNL